jgi:hypothetical protein
MPGTATFSSGYTSELADRAIYSDQARILARLQTIDVCSPSIKSTAWAPASSVIERKAQQVCGNPIDALSYPKVATTSSAYTLSLQNTIGTCSKQYRFIPPKCCPPITIANTQKPTNQPGCTPSRFF